MWSNYCVISMDVGELAESAKAVGRVFEMTADGKGERTVGVIDLEVYERLVDAVTSAPSKLEDALEGRAVEEGLTPERAALRFPNEGHGLCVHVEKMIHTSILPRVSATSTESSSSSRIYRGYARLLEWKGAWEESLKAYLDAYRSGVAGTMEKGETDLVRWKEAAKQVEEIVERFKNFGPRIEEEKSFNWRLQAKSLVRTFIAKSKDNFEGEDPEWSRLTDMVEELSRKD